ncbi:MAG: septal ring factor EnvC (AmiA/AmiB activator) [Cyclobacteriaceae bacterium]|jgi:septal ring factor EnvC (AmiA/AmiB activator)
MFRQNMTVIRGFHFFSFFLLLLLSSQISAQKTKVQLEHEKRDNLKKIAEAEKILLDTEFEKKATLGQLRAINQQISAREGLIGSLNGEIGLLNGEITDLTIVVSSLQSDLKNLKQEYAEMIYAAYKANKGFSKLTFLFSASTFNQLFMRLKYLEQYTESRKIQAELIEIVSQELDQQRNLVEIKRAEQEVLRNQQVAENQKLINLKSRQSRVIAQLSKKEKQLRKELQNRKSAIDRLDNLIAEIVRKEIERSKSLSTEAIAVEEEVSELFESMKNKLIWPVNTGFISSKFGQHPHPVVKGIMEDNPGVDIQTRQNSEIKSVFEGKVVTIAVVPGMNNAVIVQHGDYFTLYAKLKDVKVKRGQVLKKDDIIGSVYTDKDGVSELHFQVWKGRVKLNPEKWLTVK